LNSITNAYATGAVTLLALAVSPAGWSELTSQVPQSTPDHQRLLRRRHHGDSRWAARRRVGRDDHRGAAGGAADFSNPANWGIVAGVSYPTWSILPDRAAGDLGIAYKDAGVTPLASDRRRRGLCVSAGGGREPRRGHDRGQRVLLFPRAGRHISSGGSAVIAYTTADVPSGAPTARR